MKLLSAGMKCTERRAIFEGATVPATDSVTSGLRRLLAFRGGAAAAFVFCCFSPSSVSITAGASAETGAGEPAIEIGGMLCMRAEAAWTARRGDWWGLMSSFRTIRYTDNIDTNLVKIIFSLITKIFCPKKEFKQNEPLQRASPG